MTDVLMERAGDGSWRVVPEFTDPEARLAMRVAELEEENRVLKFSAPIAKEEWS